MPIYTYTTLDDPSAGGITSASGINSAGQIVGYYDDTGIGTHAFLYSGGTYTMLDGVGVDWHGADSYMIVTWIS
jgi:probable HAF family extracellular repeat protein